MSDTVIMEKGMCILVETLGEVDAKQKTEIGFCLSRFFPVFREAAFFHRGRENRTPTKGFGDPCHTT